MAKWNLSCETLQHPSIYLFLFQTSMLEITFWKLNYLIQRIAVIWEYLSLPKRFIYSFFLYSFDRTQSVWSRNTDLSLSLTRKFYRSLNTSKETKINQTPHRIKIAIFSTVPDTGTLYIFPITKTPKLHKSL